MSHLPRLNPSDSDLLPLLPLPQRSPLRIPRRTPTSVRNEKRSVLPRGRPSKTLMERMQSLTRPRCLSMPRGKEKSLSSKKTCVPPLPLYSLTISTYITLLTSNNNSSTLRLTLVTPMLSLLILTLTELPMLPLSSIPLRLPPSSSPLRTAALFPGVRSASTLSAYLLLSRSPARPLP